MIGSGLIRVVVGSFIALALGTGVGLWQLSGDSAPASTPVARAVKDDIVVSVGGVGRIVQATSSAEIAVPGTASGGAGATAALAGSAASGTGSAPGAATTAPADGVFPRTSGRIVKFLVAPGDHVVAGQPLALLDDGETSAATTKLARNDVETAVALGKSPDWVREQLVKSSADYGIPQNAVITPTQQDNRMQVRVQFTQPIEFPGFVYDYEFDYTAKSSTFLTIH